MIDKSVADMIEHFEEHSADALGYGTPGYQPNFHAVLDARVRSVRVEDPLSVVAPHGAFFVVDNGDGTRGYTRAGALQVVDGYLVTGDGRRVLGYPPGKEQGELQPIRVPAGTPNAQLMLRSDGSLSLMPEVPKSPAIADDGHPVAALPDDSDFRPLAILDRKTGVASSAQPGPGTTVDGVRGGRVPSYATPDAVPGASASERDVTATLPASPSVVSLPTDPLGVGVPPTGAVSGTVSGKRRHSRPGSSQEDELAPTMRSGIAEQGAPLSPEHVQSETPTASFGRIALACFADGTTVDHSGAASSKVPLELAPPGATPRLGLLKTWSRDLGSVDHLSSILAINDATQRLNAVLQAERQRQSFLKTATGLIK